MLTQSIINFLYTQSKFAAIVFLIIAILALIWRKKNPTILYGLWSIIFIRFLLPPHFSHKWSLRSVVETWIYALIHKPIHAQQTVWHQEEFIGAPIPKNLAYAVNNWGWQEYLLLAWIAGIFILLCLFFMRRAYFFRLARHGKPANHQLYKMCRQWQDRFGIHRKVIVKISHKTPTAFTVGISNPIIVLPAELPQDTEAMIAHELAHIQRYDDFWIVLQNIISIIYFFHPAVWLASRQIYIARECICDSMVLSERKIDRSTYGQSLINSLKFGFWRAAGVGTLGFGSTKNAMKIRIRNIKENRMIKNYIWIIVAVVAAAIFVLPMAGMSIESPATNAAPKAEKTKTFSHPLAGQEYRVTSAYGMREHPITKEKKFHQGVDFGAKRNTPVFTIADGTVTKTEQGEKGVGYGKYVEIQHTDGYMTRYAQLEAIFVIEGQSVKSGEKIGSVGSSGMSTAPHLHLELWKDGKHVDPMKYLK